jgi:hypothetical protein
MQTHVSISEIAERARIDEKTARSRLRRLYRDKDESNLPERLSKTRWKFSRPDAKVVKKLISD